jgi:hypothetical protein
MNNFELEIQLKSLRVPGRPDEYWKDFPQRIRLQLRREPSNSAPPRAWRSRVAWLCDFALATAMVFVCIDYHPLQTASAALIRHERNFDVQLARLDAGLHRLMLNTDGISHLLAEAD